MELRSAEEGVQEILAEYRRLGETEKWHLPEIISSYKHSDELSSPSPQPQPMDAGNVLSTLESLHERLDSMKGKMDRFRKRLGEVRSCVSCCSINCNVLFVLYLMTNLISVPFP